MASADIDRAVIGREYDRLTYPPVTTEELISYARGLGVTDPRQRGDEEEAESSTSGFGRYVAVRRFIAPTLSQLAPGAAVDHKRLDGVFAWIAAQWRDRDAARLANPKLTRREKQRIRSGAHPPGPATLNGQPDEWGRPVGP